jgi:hypothetical protein
MRLLIPAPPDHLDHHSLVVAQVVVVGAVGGVVGQALVKDHAAVADQLGRMDEMMRVCEWSTRLIL